MSSAGRRALTLFGSAIALGVAADVLFQGRPLGLNVAVFAIGFVAALALILRAGRAPLHQGRRWMALPLLLFAAAFAWHDSPLLTAANALALVGALSLGALRRAQPRPEQATLGEYAAGLISATAGAFGGTVNLLETEMPWDDAFRGLRGTRAAAVGRGLAIGLPFLALFGALFVAADAVFRRLAASALPTHLLGSWTHVAIALAAAWAAAGLLRDLAAPRDDDRLIPPDTLLAPARPRLGGLEIAIVLGLLDVLFLAFVAVQARYLFGGRSVVLTHQHLTYAQYARHGFFELLAVSALVVTVVLAANALAREHLRAVRLLSGALVLLELAVAASALQRMRVYVDQYGLTELRIYVSGVIIWIAVVLAWSVPTVLRARSRRFAIGAIVAGFAATAALNVVNPDALIVRTNVSRGHVDPAYLAQLSDDAVPVLIERLPSLEPSAQRQVATALLVRRTRTDALGWNASRSRAERALVQARPQLMALAG